MPDSDSNTTETLQTVETAFDVLDELRRRRVAGVTALADDLDLSKSVVHRHLATLVERGWAARDGKRYYVVPTTDEIDVAFDVVDVLKRCGGATSVAVAEAIDRHEGTAAAYLDALETAGYVVADGETYANGLRFLDVGERVKYETGIFDIVVEEIDKLAAESGEVGLFSLLENGENVLLYKASGEEAIHTAHETGMREPLHCSALGKAILSELPEERVDAILDEHGMEAFTEHTITDREELLRDLAATRERGYSVDDEEAKPGLRCVAAPVVSDEIGVRGAVSVTAPKSRMRGERFEDTLPDLVRSAANVIEVSSIYVE